MNDWMGDWTDRMGPKPEEMTPEDLRERSRRLGELWLHAYCDAWEADRKRREALEKVLRTAVEYFEADYSRPDWFDEAAALTEEKKP